MDAAARQAGDGGRLKFDKRRDAGSYDSHAAQYDRFVQRLAGPLADEICALAGVEPGQRVLDVGCGSGLASRRAARIVGPRGVTVGLDLSQGMVAFARASVAGLGAGAPHFLVQDAEALAFPPASFDAVLSLCAVRHFPHIGRALGEMRRVLKPGGKLVVSYGHARPVKPLPLLRHFARRAAQELLSPVRPRLVGPGWLTAQVERALPAPEEAVHTHWGEQQPERELVRQVRAAGFQDVEASWKGTEVRFSSAEELWDAQTAIVTRVRKLLLAAPAGEVARLKERFLRRANSVLSRGGALIYPYGAYFVRGVAQTK